ncbi:MAG: phenylpropionate dioxygenase-like ring-hydroxylating dioxygenase large terminal subunit [Paracrocinitomix sp.]|jgi:phenylpropionate dioxygenase-like ring-hydroxylating dioxygenase large terminal subunit
MRHERQLELLDRVAAAGPRLQGLHAEASMMNPASAYTDADRFEREQRELFGTGVLFMALSCELPNPGDFVSGAFNGVEVLVIRQDDGSLRSMVNGCRHRGAPVVEPGSSGNRAGGISCPYHAWTYELDGALRARPGSAGAFDDVTVDCGLHARAVAEKYGLVFIRPDSIEPIDVDAYLTGAEDDLGSFGLADYVQLDSRVNTWNMNWKLVLDTFSESYHIRTLHKTTLAPTFNSDTVIFEPFGRNLFSVGLRKDVVDELAKPRDEWSLLPYATIQYFLVPNGLVVHQVDHVEVWRVEPLTVDTCRTVTSIYSPTEPVTERSRNYFIKNLDLLLHVTGTEDFPLMEQIQRSLASGALPEVIYGRNEPPLIHFHRSINQALSVNAAASS